MTDKCPHHPDSDPSVEPTSFVSHCYVCKESFTGYEGKVDGCPQCGDEAAIVQTCVACLELHAKWLKGELKLQDDYVNSTVDKIDDLERKLATAQADVDRLAEIKVILARRYTSGHTVSSIRKAIDKAKE